MRGTFKVNRTFWLPEQGAEPTVQSSTIKRVHSTRVLCAICQARMAGFKRPRFSRSPKTNVPIERSDSSWLSMNVR